MIESGIYFCNKWGPAETNKVHFEIELQSVETNSRIPELSKQYFFLFEFDDMIKVIELKNA